MTYPNGQPYRHVMSPQEQAAENARIDQLVMQENTAREKMALGQRQQDMAFLDNLQRQQALQNQMDHMNHIAPAQESRANAIQAARDIPAGLARGAMFPVDAAAGVGMGVTAGMDWLTGNPNWAKNANTIEDARTGIVNYIPNAIGGNAESGLGSAAQFAAGSPWLKAAAPLVSLSKNAAKTLGTKFKNFMNGEDAVKNVKHSERGTGAVDNAGNFDITEGMPSDLKEFRHKMKAEVLKDMIKQKDALGTNPYFDTNVRPQYTVAVPKNTAAMKQVEVGTQDDLIRRKLEGKQQRRQQAQTNPELANDVANREPNFDAQWAAKRDELARNMQQYNDIPF